MLICMYMYQTSGINPRYDICYFTDNIFILYLILSPQMITPVSIFPPMPEGQKIVILYR